MDSRNHVVDALTAVHPLIREARVALAEDDPDTLHGWLAAIDAQLDQVAAALRDALAQETGA
jgi:hypothetical protein